MFNADCLPILIGSLPFKDHKQAMEAILSNTPTIPLWPQLPLLAGEGMIRQFLSGFPGLQEEGSKFWIDTDRTDFGEQMTAFYEEYFQIKDNPSLLFDSRFALTDDTAKGFRIFTESIPKFKQHIFALKGQVTGPVTAGIGTKDQHGQSIIYNDNLRDILIKHLILKSCWQIEAMKTIRPDIQPILFVDEPAIVSFGSSSFMGVTKEMVSDAVAAVVSGIKKVGGLAGVHICANGDWGPVLTSTADIISFDAYFYFDNFVLFKEELIHYLDRGGILAWGIVPTSDAQILIDTNADTLFSKWQEQLRVIAPFGLSPKKIMQQTLIAPSCGTGSLSPELAKKVLELTAEVSRRAHNLLSSLV